MQTWHTHTTAWFVRTISVVYCAPVKVSISISEGYSRALQADTLQPPLIRTNTHRQAATGTQLHAIAGWDWSITSFFLMKLTRHDWTPGLACIEGEGPGRWYRWLVRCVPDPDPPAACALLELASRIAGHGWPTSLPVQYNGPKTCPYNACICARSFCVSHANSRNHFGVLQHIYGLIIAVGRLLDCAQNKRAPSDSKSASVVLY
jgi:hypothetical protein